MGGIWINLRALKWEGDFHKVTQFPSRMWKDELIVGEVLELAMEATSSVFPPQQVKLPPPRESLTYVPRIASLSWSVKRMPPTPGLRVASQIRSRHQQRKFNLAPFIS